MTRPKKQTGRRAGRSETPVTRDAQREATRTAILEAALASFAEYGYAGSSTRNIAALGRVHHALIKYHFENKETLWRATVSFLFERQAVELRPPPFTGKTRAERREFARHSLREFVRYCARHPEHARLMVQESVRDNPQLRWATETYISGTARVGRDFVRLLRKEKLVPDISEVALVYMLVGAAQTIYMLAPEVRQVWNVDPMQESMIEAHIEAMLAVFIP